MRNMMKKLAILLVLVTVLTMALPAAAAGVSYLPDVTKEMTEYTFWSELQEDPDEVILTMEEIKAFNQNTIDASGTMVMDLKDYPETFDGLARNKALRTSATADAEYYYGWTYDPGTGKLADWSYYQRMIDNTYDPKATADMPYRYGIAVNRTVLKAFPSDNPIWDDPADVDFDYQSVSAVRVNEPVLIYTTSWDGQYYLGRIHGCSGWIPARDVALCADKEEWLSAWDLPSEDLLVVYDSKIYTENSIYAPDVSKRLLTQGTALELVKDLEPDEVVINRYPYHNYVVYLPVRRADGTYEKQMAFISENAKVSEGYLPLTKENIAMVAMENLSDTYGWGGMLDVEDCSGQIRTIYACFGMNIGRNGNWQWNMNVEKIDVGYMTSAEKSAVLDELPLGAALCFPGHEMLYLGKYQGKHYVISTVGTIMSPTSGDRLRVRGVILNTLDIKRANGQTWLEAVDKILVPGYARLDGKTYDFPDTQWYHDGVVFCVNNSLMNKLENGSFGADEPASRGVCVNALWKLADSPKAEEAAAFVDVTEDSGYLKAVSWAGANGIFGGYGQGRFGLEDTITREQMITVLYRYAVHQGYDVAAEGMTDLTAFKDFQSVSAYAVEALQWACDVGLIEGVPGSSGYSRYLLPRQNTTRAQLAVMLLRFDQWMDQAAKAETQES